MRDIFLLVGVQLSGMLGIGRLLHTRDRMLRARMALVAGCVLVAAGSIALAAWALCGEILPTLKLMGMLHVLPALLFAASSILCLVTSFFTGASALFDTRDVQILLPMPLRTQAIVCARLLGLYLIDLAVELVLFIPIMAQYASYSECTAGALWAACVLGACALPVLPLLIGTALGTLIHALSARSRHKNIVSIILLCVFTLGMMALSTYVSMRSFTLDIDALLHISRTVTQGIIRMYPPTWLFVEAVSGKWGFGVALLGGSALLFAAAVYALGKAYIPLQGTLAAAGPSRRRVSAQAWRTRTPLGALLLREARRMVASPVYAVNTTFGMLLAVILSGALLVFGDNVFSLLSLGSMAGIDLRVYAAGGAGFVLFLFLCLAPTTSVSISLEGKAFTGLRALPIRARTLFAAKAGFNMLLMLPATLLSAALVIAALQLSAWEALACLALPLSGVILAPAWGLIANLLFPRFDWRSETEVVKQGLSTACGVLGILFLAIVPAALLLHWGVPLSNAALVLAGVYALLGALCWGVLLTWGQRRLEQIGNQ